MQHQEHDPSSLRTTPLPPALLAPECPHCGKPMHARSVIFSALDKTISYVCILCSWRQTKSAQLPRQG